MSVWARSDVASVTVSEAHKGCGKTHVRPAPGGRPVDVWEITCPGGCEDFLRTDPLFASNRSELPESPDEVKSREDFEKRGVLERDQVMALAMAKIAGIELSEPPRRPALGLVPPLAVTAGQVECPNGHGCDPGTRFCTECGSAMREEAKRCPEGHENAPSAKFCADCGASLAAGAGAPEKGLGSMRAAELRELARARGLDDSGSRADVLTRLRAAA